MKERFEGPNNRNLLEAIERQELVGRDSSLARGLIERGQLIQHEQSERLIVQGNFDTDIYLLIAGSVAIVVNGSQVAPRTAGQHVGDISAIEPSLPRSATVVATERTVSLRLSSNDLLEIADAFPQIWKHLARECARRLSQRNSTIPLPNESPKLFIISSTESLDIANALREGLERDVFSTVWTEGVFFAGGYPLEALEKQVNESDFAVAIADADDIVLSRGKVRPTVRDNVLFELGLFMGALKRFRSILVHPDTPDLKLPSDLQGLTTIPYSRDVSVDIKARLVPVCNDVRALVSRLGVRRFIDPA